MPFQAVAAMHSPMFISRSYDEFEEFDADTREWQVETAMIKPGGFRADVLHAINPVRGYHFARARMDGHIRQEGEPPNGLRTICVPGEDQLRMDWRHQHVAGDDMLVDGADVIGIDGNIPGPAFLTAPPVDVSIPSSSAAANAGIDFGVTEDIVGTARPQGSAPDIGAYEAFIVETSDVRGWALYE